MTIYTEGTRAGEIVNKEFDRGYNSIKITVSGGSYPAGQALAKLANGNYTAYDPEGDAPLDSVAAVLYAAVDASAGEADGRGFVRGPLVLSKELMVGLDEDGVADLAALNPPIIVR